ncbi:MAG TPA: transglutaminase family protein [Ktedonobacterales bacterium]|nr:transglutaminase family protein [Ktedonobacterales bacterium]
MRLNVEHRTVFDYDEPIYETATEVRLQPIDHHGTSQRCLAFTLVVDPAAAIAQYVDFYGNQVHHFNVLQRHRRVSIMAISLVETGLGRVTTGNDEPIMLQEFLRESPYIRFASPDEQVEIPAIREFAGQFQREQPPELLAEAICRRINETFTYEPGVTDAQSTSDVVMALGRGVCQDFAHVMIATCRALDLPARYVSGYVYGGPAAEHENQASHAWCEVFCGAMNGWVGFDPTHNTLFVDDRYIRIGSGRDYGDVSPIRGTYKGQAEEHMTVTVRLTAADEGLLAF